MIAKVRALVAEDEPHARKALTDHLADVDWLEVVAVAGDGREAIALAERQAPGLLFLDVRLPEISGLEVARRLRGSAEIVFTTAYDRYAVSAFELGALDYLLKPFGRERLNAALSRVRSRLAEAAETTTVNASERLRETLGSPPLRWLFARQGERIVPIDTASIRHVRARGDYSEVAAGGATHTLHVSLSDLQSRLDPERFLQIHRSHLVNLDAVAELRRHDERRLAVVLKDGTTIVASRAASEALRRRAR
ncbi:MAG: response regulator transcription factor [Acidobacteria bacterium]|nr:response regulator transcription factor [Acidobacteriota bacterium]